MRAGGEGAEWTGVTERPAPLEDSTVWAAELGGSQDPPSGARGSWMRE